MTCQGNDEQLGDYVDGTLDPPALAAFTTHLAGCARCQALAADFKALRLAAQTLEPALPSAAAWSRIAAAVEAEHGARTRRRWWRLGGQTAWQPAAAVAMAVVLTTGLTWIGGRLVPVAGEPPTASAATTEPASLANVDLDVAARDYAREIAGLEAITAAERETLDPLTADVLQVNLTVVDTAIGESRTVLASEPENDLAIASLFEALRRKLALLQDSVALINEMRSADWGTGNPEAARGSSVN